MYKQLIRTSVELDKVMQICIVLLYIGRDRRLPLTESLSEHSVKWIYFWPDISSKNFNLVLFNVGRRRSVYKPRGKRSVVVQLTIILNNSYLLVKVGSKLLKNLSTWFVHVPYEWNWVLKFWVTDCADNRLLSFKLIWYQ